MDEALPPPGEAVEWLGSRIGDPLTTRLLSDRRGSRAWRVQGPRGTVALKTNAPHAGTAGITEAAGTVEAARYKAAEMAQEDEHLVRLVDAGALDPGYRVGAGAWRGGRWLAVRWVDGRPVWNAFGGVRDEGVRGGGGPAVRGGGHPAPRTAGHPVADTSALPNHPASPHPAPHGAHPASPQPAPPGTHPGDPRPGDPLRRPWILGVARTWAGHLARMHAVGWVHADVQPTNTLVTDDGRAVLVDYALACGPGGGRRLPYRGALTHTTAPEIADALLSTPADVHLQAGPEADVWGLGASLFWCWTGRRPVFYEDGEDRREKLAAIARGGTVSLPEARPWPFPEFEDVIAACLEPAPGDRPTAAALVGLLTR
ncbi:MULTISPECIES: protein kinase domain-containing protein [unclassified Streptomyces]|uniref:protein kinase domain-containing protein n=1 Tax=unclassified Streptomyces TaxID=2593676 RepID=UPI0016617E77|nr:MULTISPECIES: phosphotransferase [unclassified Streptomyces]